MQACLKLIYGKSSPCKPAWSWRRLRRVPASLLEAGEDFDESLQACLTLAKTSTEPCKPAWGWRRLRRVPARLHRSDSVYFRSRSTQQWPSGAN